MKIFWWLLICYAMGVIVGNVHDFWAGAGLGFLAGLAMVTIGNHLDGVDNPHDSW